MIGKHVIRLGDPTTHGGVVVSATGHFEMLGKPVARLGDKVTCPILGHGGCTIAEGDPLWSIDGIPVALEGHKTSCGASLISTLPNVTRSYEGMGAPNQGEGAASVTAGVRFAGDDGKKEAHSPYDEQTQLISPPMEGLPYFIEVSDGRSFSGRVDQSNLLPRIDTMGEDKYIVYWGEEALARMDKLES